MTEEDTPPTPPGDQETPGMLKTLAEGSEDVMEVLELLTAFFMLGLFAIGVFDLGLKLYTMLIEGTFTDPDQVITLIDTALLLLIIVEVYRTVIAYIEDLNILPIVINVGLIAMARKVISFRTGKYATPEDALVSAGAYGLLFVVLIVAFFVLHHVQEETEFDVYLEPFSAQSDRRQTREE